jgi:hypothetical protein
MVRGVLRGRVDGSVGQPGLGRRTADAPSGVLNEQRKQVALELNVDPGPLTVLARYEQQFIQLQDALSKGINAGDSDAAEAIRDLVETVTVFRDPSVQAASRLRSPGA